MLFLMRQEVSHRSAFAHPKGAVNTAADLINSYVGTAVFKTHSVSERLQNLVHVFIHTAKHLAVLATGIFQG